jgi:hypothetical protein
MRQQRRMRRLCFRAHGLQIIPVTEVTPSEISGTAAIAFEQLSAERTSCWTFMAKHERETKSLEPS